MFSKENAILMTFFTQEKGTLLPEKGHLAKLGGPVPPGSYAPVHAVVSLVKSSIVFNSEMFRRDVEGWQTRSRETMPVYGCFH